MVNDYKIYKVIASLDNMNLLERANGIFNSQNQIPDDLKYMLNVCSSLATKSKLIECSNSNFESTQFSQIVYFVSHKNKIVTNFTHSFKPETNQIYLDYAHTHATQQKKGHATNSYKIVVSDIVKTFNPSSICGNATTEKGKEFMAKFGFLPNTKPDSVVCNSIFYLNNEKPYLIELIDLPVNRQISSAPNIALYNIMLKDAKMAGTFNAKKAKQNFYQIKSVYDIKVNAKYNPNITNVKPANVADLDLPETFYFNEQKSKIDKQIEMLKKINKDS